MKKGTLITLGPDQMLHHFSNPSANVYYVEEGEIAGMIIGQSGTAKVIHLARKGSIIGEMFAFAAPPSPSLGCLVTTRASKVRALPIARVRELFQLDSEFAEDLAASLSRKAIAYAKQLEDLCFRGVRRRLACLLLALFEASGDKVCRLSQQALADMVSAHRVTVSQALSELQELGAVGVGKRKVFLLDRDRLLAEASATDR